MTYESNIFEVDEQNNVEKIYLSYRLCEYGEQLTNTGECLVCAPGTYLLTLSNITNYKTNVCVKCPSTGNCFGGKND